MSYEFTNNWNTRHEHVWTELFKSRQPKRAIEIGSYEGRSTIFMLDHIHDLNELVCIDSWDGGEEHNSNDFKDIENRFDKNISLHPSGNKVKKVKSTSHEALIGLLGAGERESFDFVYVDGDHTAQGTIMDAVLAWKLLAYGGIMIFDDYLWRINPYNHAVRSPKIAIDAFTTIFSHDLVILPTSSSLQVICVKTNMFKWHDEFKAKNPNFHPIIEG